MPQRRSAPIATLAALLLGFAADRAVAQLAPPEAEPAAPVAEPGAAAAARPLVLVYSRTAGFRHDSIAAGVAMLRELGGEHGFAIEHSEDAALFASQDLTRYRAIVWLNTTGDALDAQGEAAFRRYVENGGGYVGIHAAADTEHDWPWYGELLGCGAWFVSHPPIQPATIDVVDAAHVSTRHLAARVTLTDEWYNFAASPATCAHVLLRLDEQSYRAGSRAMGADHPIAWHREQGRGRAWYTGLGHRIELYADLGFRAHVLGGIRWAARIDR